MLMILEKTLLIKWFNKEKVKLSNKIDYFNVKKEKVIVIFL